MEDWRLLREYVDRGSEVAFAALVKRHLNLVYSVALRRLGDPHAAEDVAQSVFCLLASKARQLGSDTALVSWLYQTACFKASKYWRSETRRRQREQEAVLMTSTNSDDTAASWQQLAPYLDDAMNELGEQDRLAILQRFFQRKPLREIGEALGIGEDAARMRVSRALDKLRGSLVRNTAVRSSALLGPVLAEWAVQSAPVSVEPFVQSAVLAAIKIASAPSLLSTILTLMRKRKLKTALVTGLVILTAVTVLIWLRPRGPNPVTTVALTQSEEPATPETIAEAPSITDLQPTALAATPELQPPNRIELRLALVGAETGQPIPDGEVQCLAEIGPKSSLKTLRSDREGVVRVTVDPNTAQLDLTTRIEGFADTRLSWRTDRGERIPREYTLRLRQPVSLGGWVLEASGRPVSGAKVELNGGDVRPGIRPEFPIADLTANTDESGQWRANRIAPELVRQLWIRATHPDLITSARVNLSVDPEIERQFRDASHVFRLGAATPVLGRVLDAYGQPVHGAKIIAGGLHSVDTRETKTTPDGSFALTGCPAGTLLLTAQATGFAPTAIESEVSATSGPVTIVLTEGKPLPVRVLDRGGNPLARAAVWVVPDHESFRIGGGIQPQFRLEASTDAEGRVMFTNVPDCALWAAAGLRGYISDSAISARAGEPELVLSLHPILTVTGTVRDSSTGQGVPKFRVVAGRPEPGGPYWSAIDRFQMTFEGGSFRHVFDEGVTSGTNLGYVLKFEAKGYAPSISRIIAPDEGVAELDILLQPVMARQVTVFNPDQTPAAYADVGLVSSRTLARNGSALHLVPGGFDRSYAGDEKLLEKTDEVGQIKLELAQDIRSIIVANSSGYLEVAASEVQDGAVIRVQPWGQITGTLPLREGQKEISQVTFEFDPQRENEIFAQFNSGFRVTPDSRGAFEFPLAPPGRHHVIELVPSSKNSWTHGRVVEVEVRAGETTQAKFGRAESKAAAR